MSRAYEIYKEQVGGITFTGDKMKELEELPEKIVSAWKKIDEYYDSRYARFSKEIMTVCVHNFRDNVRNDKTKFPDE